MPPLRRQSRSAYIGARHPIQGRRMVCDGLREENEWRRLRKDRRRSNGGRRQGEKQRFERNGFQGLERKETRKEEIDRARSRHGRRNTSKERHGTQGAQSRSAGRRAGHAIFARDKSTAQGNA